MINGHFQALWDEARQHWQHGLSAAVVVKDALPVSEWIRIAVVAIVTAVVTSQITLARLDERIIALKSERDLIIKNRDAQVEKIERHMDRVEASVLAIQVQLAGMKK